MSKNKFNFKIDWKIVVFSVIALVLMITAVIRISLSDQIGGIFLFVSGLLSVILVVGLLFGTRKEKLAMQVDLDNCRYKLVSMTSINFLSTLKDIRHHKQFLSEENCTLLFDVYYDFYSKNIEFINDANLRQIRKDLFLITSTLVKQREGNRKEVSPNLYILSTLFILSTFLTMVISII